MTESRFQILGAAEPTVLSLPSSLDEYRDLWADLERLHAEEPLAWKSAMRLWSAGDLYFFGLFVLSMGSVWDPYWGRPRFLAPEQLEFARWVQFESKGSTLVAARFFGKSSWTTFADNIRMKLIDPNRVCCIFSETRELAGKHNNRIGQELLANRLLVTIWDDRFHATREAYEKFSEHAITIKRSSARMEATFEAQAYTDKLPTGSHYDERRYDDIETERLVTTKEKLDKNERQFISSQDLSSPTRWAIVVGTYYHPAGLMRKTHLEMGWKLKLLPAEILPESGPVESEVSDPALGPFGGRPYYFHPQELRDVMRDKGGKGNPKARKSYVEQMICDPTLGEPNRLDRNHLIWYDEDPLELAADGTLYLCVDCSKGVGDPTWAWVWRLGYDRRAYWVGGFRKRLDPAARRREVALLALQFNGLGNLVAIRMEEFGAAEYIETQTTENSKYGISTPIHKCAENKDKMARAFERWYPELANGRIVFPRHLWSFDEVGQRIDLVDYFLQFEFDPFPKPVTDDGLDAGGLLWEPVGRVGELDYPVRTRRRDGIEPVQYQHSVNSDESGSYMSVGAY
jgi:hypothetical protein